MPRLPLRLLILLLFALLVSFPMPARAAPNVIIGLVQIAGDKADDEFVELMNLSDQDVSLSGWSLRKKTKADASDKGSSLKTLSSSNVLPAHGKFLWANANGIFKDLADTTTSSSLADNNSLGLFDDSGALVDSVTWGTDHVFPFSPSVSANPGKIERLTRDPASLAWTLTSNKVPTNSQGESFVEAVPPPPLPAAASTVILNEILPNPKAKGDQGEFIELYNFGDLEANLAGWSLHDATKTGKYVFPADARIASHGYLVIGDTDFTFSLNNSKETISLFESAGTLVHSVSYEKTREGISLNYENGKLRGSRESTPGAPNAFDHSPTVKEKVPKKGYKGFALQFDANGKDKEKDKLKYTWDFGDGHKSYKAKTEHTYKKTGKYTVTLRIDDGKNETVETYSIKITKFKYPDIRVTALLPNPAGKDTESEWVEIENRGKDKVDLLGYAIATGTKKLVNHPIRKSAVIEKGGIKRITREEALIVLGNTEGKIELRAPDGHVLQDLKYAFEKSLPEDAVLKKETGSQLALVLPPTPKDEIEIVNNELDEELAQAEISTRVLGASTENDPEPSRIREEAPLSEPLPWFLELLERLNARLNETLVKLSR